MTVSISRRALIGAGLIVPAAARLPAVAIASPNRWTSVGPIRVAAIRDASTALSAAGVEAGSARMETMVHVLRFRGETVLIGAGFGAHPGMPHGGMIDRLAELGLSPANIDLVLLTHLHPEHVGGMATAQGEPVFPNARVVSCRTEWRWWNHNDQPSGLPAAYLPFVRLARLSTAPYERAGRLVTFTGTETVSPGIVGFPALGHTAGHSLYRLTDGAHAVLTLGDIVHGPEQIADPSLQTALDQSPRSAVSTRRFVLDQAAREGVAVVGSHIASPKVGRVSRLGAGFALAPWAAETG